MTIGCLMSDCTSKFLKNFDILAGPAELVRPLRDRSDKKIAIYGQNPLFLNLWSDQ